MPRSVAAPKPRRRADTALPRPVFPFSAIVGQEELKLALLIAAVEPAIGGVLAFGDRGTGKSTAIRALAALLPKMKVIEGCRYHCDPDAGCALGGDCPGAEAGRSVTMPVPVVDLPLGATEDRVVGALDLERALSQGVKSSSARASPSAIPRASCSSAPAIRRKAISARSCSTASASPSRCARPRTCRRESRW
jgi:magnesium chelatase subunit I